MTHEKNMMDYQDFLRKKNLAMNPEDLLFGKSYCFDKANVHHDFLKSQPMLGDFVATNEKGEVMEKPEMEKYGYTTNDFFDGGCNGWTIEDGEEAYNEAMQEYQSALDRILWKGWKWRKYSDTESMYDLKHKDCSKDIAHKNRGVITFHYSDTTYNELITSGVKLERIQKK